MLTTIAYGLAIVLNLLFLYIGLRFLFVPWASAAGYGVPAKQDRVYLTIKGIRDSGYGLVGLALLAFAGAPAEAWFMLVVALVPLGDMFVVLRNGGTKSSGVRHPLRDRGGHPHQCRAALRAVSDLGILVWSG